MTKLENYFEKYRNHIIGSDYEHPFKSGQKSILYADWAASGRLYGPIEEYIQKKLGPYVANTHTETNLTGTVMTSAYHQAHQIIKNHVNAAKEDQLLFAGFGMTAVVNKFQRILGLHVPEQYKKSLCPVGNKKALVIITHMEHHSNQTSWVECMVDLKIIKRNDDGLPDLNHLREILQENKDRELIIGSFSSCSNVTGIETPYHEMAEIVHEFGGYCFVDFSASAPYVKINMHPEKENQHLDAIFFSPHKFLGGPGSSGVIVFNRSLYHNTVPDTPGGGTVAWTNPWGEHQYFEDIETREDGGTPGFLQAVKAALTIILKEDMGIQNLLQREHNLKDRLIQGLDNIPDLHMLERQQTNRIGFVSFYIDNIHHNLIVRLLNDHFGIQTRGGCSCAGTYGHILLNIDYHESRRITKKIDSGDLSEKPGWIRVSVHPTMKDAEIDYIIEAIKSIRKDIKKLKKEYRFNPATAEFESLKSADFNIDINKNFRDYII